jgi:parallel beta-helix repeat protein
MKKRTLLLACGLLLSGAASWAAVYSPTGAGTSTIGTGGDYASLAAACAAITTAGSRDGTAWTFEILNDLTETANSDIRCTVDPAGSITFRPASGVRATITWPNTIAANLGSKGHISIGASITSPVTYQATNNIIFDGSNTPGGTTRDLYLVNQLGDPEAGVGIIQVRGNNDNIVIKNLTIQNRHNATSSRAIEFTSDSTGGIPDNWTVDNCLIISEASTSGEAIRASNSGTITSGTAQTGYTISNNTILAGSRGIFLNQSAGGTVTGNTIRLLPGSGFSGWGIMHFVANSATGFTLNITKNTIDYMLAPNTSAGDFGIRGILVTPNAVAGGQTYNIRDNIVGGWVFTGATSADSSYEAISIRGAATGNAAVTINVENNSINMNNTTQVTGATLGRVHAITRTATSSPYTTNIRNNIIRFMQGGTNAYAIYAASSANLTVSGNNVVIGGSSAGFAHIGGTARTVFTNGSTGFQDVIDTTAQNVDPTATTGGTWVNAAAGGIIDLHFNGTPVELSAVSSTAGTDIDGDARGVSAIPGADVVNATVNTYTWNATGTAYFSEPTNWSPNRTTPRFNDVLVFDGGAAVEVLDVRDNHLGGLRVENSGTDVSFANLGGTAGVRLAVFNGGAGSDFVVGAGATLRLRGNGMIMVDLNGGATGQVDGDLVFSPVGASWTQVLVKSGSTLTFTNGSTAAMAPSSTAAVLGFGSSNIDSAAGSVIFQSGATFYHGGLKDGTRLGGAGGSPFGSSSLTSANAIAVFNSGSSYVVLQSAAPVISDRTYGNFIWRSNGGASPVGTLPFTIQNNFEVRHSGAVGQHVCNLSAFTGAITIGGDLIVETGGPALNMNSAPTATTNITVGGNVDIQNPALFTAPADSDHVWVFNGSSNQSLDFAGATLTNATLNNASGATLGDDLTVSGTLTYSAGDIALGGNTLIAGTVVRSIDATTTGARLFPVGTGGNSTPVTFDITSAGTGTGTMTVTSTGTDHPNVLDAAGTINRYWSLTPSGISGFTATLTFNYLDSDLGSVNEASLVAGRYTGTGTIWDVLGGTVNTVANTVTVTGVTTLSDWTLGEAASLPVELDMFVID